MISWIFLCYIFVAIVVFARMFYLAFYLSKQSGQKLDVGDHVPSMLVDSIFWSYFIVWYGLKSFLQDLGKPQ